MRTKPGLRVWLLISRGKRLRLKRGELRFALLYLLKDHARHGYDLIRACRSLGWGSPSPGSIYPLLAMLESEGLLSSHDDEGRRLYEITDAGRQALRENAALLRELIARSGHQEENVDVDDDESRLEGSIRRLLYAVTLLASDATPTAVDLACDVLDATRRKIYALLASE
jgi:DNA-binding PadR family transcriptional regulator